jgi:hypothetical protein
MARLLVHVEGQTEETFVNEVLRDHLTGCGYESVNARLLGNARLRKNRGGVRSWEIVRTEIVHHLKQDRNCISTTMVDFYGLPQYGDGAWPGRAEANAMSSERKAPHVEHSLLNDLTNKMGQNFNPNRFVPFIIMHEFEGLLFSNCTAFASAICKPELETTLKNIRDQFTNPEEINDSPLTAPSKRIQSIVPGYNKEFYGTLAALEIGLERIRMECPHFNCWLSRLESLIS